MRWGLNGKGYAIKSKISKNSVEGRKRRQNDRQGQLRLESKNEAEQEREYNHTTVVGDVKTTLRPWAPGGIAAIYQYESRRPSAVAGPLAGDPCVSRSNKVQRYCNQCRAAGWRVRAADYWRHTRMHDGK